VLRPKRQHSETVGEVYLRFGVLLFAFVGTHNGESLVARSVGRSVGSVVCLLFVVVVLTRNLAQLLSYANCTVTVALKADTATAGHSSQIIRKLSTAQPEDFCDSTAEAAGREQTVN